MSFFCLDSRRIAVLPWSVGLVCALAWHPGRAASPQLRDLAPAQVFAAPQIHVAPPRPLPDTPGTEPMFSGMGYVDPESAPDIPYSFFWQEEDTNAWRRRHVSDARSEEHTSELQSLMRISYAVFCLKKKNNKYTTLIPYKT